MPVPCTACGECPAALRRPRTGQALCRACFVGAFEKEAHAAVTSGRLFRRGDTVAVAASGGKDSTVLAHLLRTLDARHGYGLRLELLAVDEGIAGYRDEALGAVYRGRDRWGLPLTVVSYRELHGWTMDRVVASAGRRSNCTFCGVFRRQALDRGAAMVGADKIATGHNADDVAETVLMNFLRGDVARLRRGTLAAPEEAESSQDGAVPRCKPLRHAYEKEIVLYAYFLGLDYFSTECRYAPHAYRGHARTLLKDLEAARASAVADLGHSAEHLALRPEAGRAARGACTRCGAVASQPVCAACLLLEGLERGLPRLGLGKGRRDRAPGIEGEAEPREKGRGLKEEATKDDWLHGADGLKALEKEPRQRRWGQKAMGAELENPQLEEGQPGALEEEEAEPQQRRVWQLRRRSQNIVGEEPEVNGEQQPGSLKEEETHHRRRGQEATGEELQLEATVRQAEAWQRRQRRNLDF